MDWSYIYVTDEKCISFEVWPAFLQDLHLFINIPGGTPESAVFVGNLKERKSAGAILATQITGITRVAHLGFKNHKLSINASSRKPGSEVVWTTWEGRFGLDKNVMVLDEKGRPASLAECLASASSCSLVFVAARQ